MTDLQTALHQFWSQFSVDGHTVVAHLSGQTENDEFPNITYSMATGSLYNASSMVAFVWLQEQDGQSVNAQRSALFQAIAEALPQQGVRIDCDHGYAILQRGTEFLSIYNTGEIVNGRKIYGGRISYVMRYYGATV